MPRWNTISISGYHLREAGSTAVQEVAFTLANAVAYVQAAQAAGARGRRVRPAAVASSSTPTTTSSRRSPSSGPRAGSGRASCGSASAPGPRAQMLRFHAQTAGSTLTAQQPENNVVRVTVQALAAILGGCQSLHTNSMDEALSLPSEAAVRTALRTQQVLAHESGVAASVDPLGGSSPGRAPHAGHRGRRHGVPRQDRRAGGAVAAIPFMQREIQDAAYPLPAGGREPCAGRRGRQRVREPRSPAAALFQPNPEVESRQAERLRGPPPPAGRGPGGPRPRRRRARGPRDREPRAAAPRGRAGRRDAGRDRRAPARRLRRAPPVRGLLTPCTR